MDPRKKVIMKGIDGNGNHKEVTVEGTTAPSGYIASRNGINPSRIEEGMYVNKIKNGCVIDHIPEGYGLGIYLAFRQINDITGSKLIPDGCYSCLLESAPTKKGSDKKDMIKVSNVQLSLEDISYIEHLAEEFDCHPTLNLIKDWQVYKKIIL